MPMITITQAGIRNLIFLNLDICKAYGPDEVSPYCLKSFSENVEHFVPCLAVVMQSSLDVGYAPQDLQTANVVPMFKSGKPGLPRNSRPISLTSVTSKLIEDVIISSMWQHINF